MPATVLVAHDDKATPNSLAALIAVGLAAVGFHDPMAALDTAEDDSRVRVLVARVDFGAGKLNGVALAACSSSSGQTSRSYLSGQPEGC